MIIDRLKTLCNTEVIVKHEQWDSSHYIHFPNINSEQRLILRNNLFGYIRMRDISDKKNLFIYNYEGVYDKIKSIIKSTWLLN